jgi:hypothetical protein
MSLKRAKPEESGFAVLNAVKNLKVLRYAQDDTSFKCVVY